jgi:hypothetical protein
MFGLLSLALLMGLAALPAGAQSVSSPFDPVTECVRNNGGLAALFIVDTSQSLRNTDPDGLRAAGIRGTVSGLIDLAGRADDLNVFVEFLEFGTVSRRSFPADREWRQLAGDERSLLAQLDVFRQRDDDEDTDYVGALEPWLGIRNDPARPPEEIGALELLERAPDGACRLVIWFSDGDIDFDVFGGQKRFEWSSDPRLDSRGDELRLEEESMQLLCAPGGLVSTLRGSGASLEGGRNFIVAIGFGEDPQDLSRLQVIAEGTGFGQTCDPATPPLGVFLPAASRELVQALFQIQVGVEVIDLCPAESGCTRFEPFFLNESVRSFTLLAVGGRDDVQSSLVAANGEELERVALAGTFDRELRNGATLSTEEVAAGIHLVKVELPSDSHDWVGDWGVEFSSAGGPDALNRASIAFTGDLQVTLRPGATLREASEGSFTVDIVTAAGTPVAPETLDTTSDLTIWVDGVAVPLPPASEDGSYRFDYAIAEGFGSESIEISGRLASRLSVRETEDPITISDWSGRVGEVEVLPIPRYPVLAEPTAFGKISGDSLTAVGDLIVEAPGERGAGCVRFGGAEIVGAEGASQPSILVRGPAGEILDPSSGCALDLGDGESASISVEVSIEESTFAEVGSLDSYWLAGTIQFSTESGADPLLGEDFEFPIRVRVDPPVETGIDWQKALGLMLLVLLPPILLLYLYNYFVGARFDDAPALQVADVPVVIREFQIQPPAGRAELADDASMRPATGPSRRSRSVTIRSGGAAVATFRAHMSAWPHIEPEGRGSFTSPNGGCVSELGSTRNRTVSRLGLNLSRAWLLEIQTSDLTPAEWKDLDLGQIPRELSGRLLVVFHALDSATRVTAMAQIRHEARDVLERELNQLLKAARPPDLSAEHRHTAPVGASIGDLGASDIPTEPDIPEFSLDDLPD